MKNHTSASPKRTVRFLATATALLCAIPAASLHSQTLRGTVKDGNTGVPVADASVVLREDVPEGLDLPHVARDRYLPVGPGNLSREPRDPMLLGNDSRRY